MNRRESIQLNENSPASFEMMKIPEITSAVEWGAQLFSLLLAIENSGTDVSDDSLARERVKILETRPNVSEILNGLNEIIALGADEESLYNLALAYGHPERMDDAILFEEKNKPNIPDPFELGRQFLALLKSFDEEFSETAEAKKIHDVLDSDVAERLKRAKETGRRIGKLIGFFMPDSATTHIRKVNFVPTDPTKRKDTGRSFEFGEEQIILSHIDNAANQDHEFLHGVINPIVEKLSAGLTEDQKGRISELASGNLKKDYGEEWYSLLCEELIRTYKEHFEAGTVEQDYEEFSQRVISLEDETFHEYYSNNPGFHDACVKIGISTVGDLRKNAREYFNFRERSRRSRVGDLILTVYEEYSSRQDKREVNFERFLLEHFSEYLVHCDEEKWRRGRGEEGVMGAKGLE